MMKWLVNNWFKSTIFLAIYSFLFIFLFIYEQDFALFLIWLHIPVYLLHETEEFVFPGGFPEMMMEGMAGKGKPVHYALMKAGFWINIPFIVFGFPFVATLATLFGLSWGMYVVYFTLIATIPHIISAITQKKFYNPGMAASMFLNLPASIFTIYYYVTNDLVSMSAHIVGLLVAIGAMAGPMILALKKAKKAIDLDQ